MSIIFNILNSGSAAYTINGVNNGNITLIRGNTYSLVINASGHPFWIQTVSGGYSSNNIYSSGITNNGTQNGTITFVVSNNTPDTLYYACRFHSSMQGRIIITNPTITKTPRISMGSLYSNNAQVFYKPHTLAPGGIGGVRNYRLKSRKT